jgi:Tim44-like domain
LFFLRNQIKSIEKKKKKSNKMLSRGGRLLLLRQHRLRNDVMPTTRRQMSFWSEFKKALSAELDKEEELSSELKKAREGKDRVKEELRAKTGFTDERLESIRSFPERAKERSAAYAQQMQSYAQQYRQKLFGPNESTSESESISESKSKSESESESESESSSSNEKKNEKASDDVTFQQRIDMAFGEVRQKYFANDRVERWQKALSDMSGGSAAVQQWAAERKRRAADRLAAAKRSAVQMLDEGGKEISDSLGESTKGVRGELAKAAEEASNTVKGLGDALPTDKTARLARSLKSKFDSLSKSRSTVDDPYAKLRSESPGAQPPSSSSSDNGRDGANVDDVDDDAIVDAEQRVDESVADSGDGGDDVSPGRTSMARVERSKIEEQLGSIKSALQSSRAFKHAADLRTRIEESENPVVQSTVDVVDSVAATTSRVANKVVGQTEQARVLTELKAVIGNSFSLYHLTAELEEDLIANYLNASAKGDLNVLKEMCGEALYNRQSETARTRRKLGHSVVYNLLDIGDVELERAFFHNERPSLLFVFEIQENICIRDKKGDIVAGADDHVQLVRYFWRLEYDLEAQRWILAEEAAASPTAIW